MPKLRTVSPYGVVYKRLTHVPDNRWSYAPPNPPAPGILLYRDRAGNHEHPIPVMEQDSVSLLRAPGTGETLCLIFDTQYMPRAPLLRYLPLKKEQGSVFKSEARFIGTNEEGYILTIPGTEPKHTPTLKTLSLVNIVKRMALHFVPAGTYWAGLSAYVIEQQATVFDEGQGLYSERRSLPTRARIIEED